MVIVTFILIIFSQLPKSFLSSSSLIEKFIPLTHIPYFSLGTSRLLFSTCSDEVSLYPFLSFNIFGSESSFVLSLLFFLLIILFFSFCFFFLFSCFIFSFSDSFSSSISKISPSFFALSLFESFSFFSFCLCLTLLDFLGYVGF